jgi:alpha-N-arabinofuranosidase
MEEWKKMTETITRRKFIRRCTTLAAGALAVGGSGPMSCSGPVGRMGSGLPITVDPRPRFALSPYLYMQFMEPLGTTDSSVDAAWDFNRDVWREDLVDTTRELAPTMMRWGGCFISYYRWKEGVGPLSERKPMVNILWGGIYNNQVGIRELVEFCRAVGADPLICVNFESDGRKGWALSAKGEVRSAGPEEAAEWVDYCNNPANAARIRHGLKNTLDVKLWQIGNETSYDPEGFNDESAARRTVDFARAMRKSDPTIKLIGWADSGWAKTMARIAGEEIQYLAFHNGYGPGGADSPLRGIEYRKDWARTWEYFMKARREPESRIQKMREETKGLGLPLAITEAHFHLPGRNRCEALSTWAAGVANARIFHTYERNGDIIKIATLADFCGNRWQNNAVMIPTPQGSGAPFLMPVGMIMALYRKHSGADALDVAAVPDDLDVTASRTDNRIFLHVANINRTQPVAARFDIRGYRVIAGRVSQIALDPEYEVFEHKPEITRPRESPVPASGDWTFPAASVSAVELDISNEEG